ncbi:MAG: NAD(P)H-hydrate dehydratase [Acidimicrobiia bacterium]
MPRSPHVEQGPPAAKPLDAALLRSWPLPLATNGDKHSRGTVLVVGGSVRTPGAVLLSGLAALRIGAGRLQIATAAPAATALAVALPEAMVAPMPVDGKGSLLVAEAVAVLVELLPGADAVLIGPGMSGQTATAEVLQEVLPRIGSSTCVVLDALALCSMDGVGSDGLRQLRDRLVVTPNRAELEQLAAAFDAFDELGEVARSSGAVVTSFGTVAAPDGRRWCIDDAAPGLGTSGSGDALAGLVAGAAARCGDAAQATCWATYAHHASGLRLTDRLAPLGFIAREIVDEVPFVLSALERTVA